MSETNPLLDSDKYEERLSQLAGPEGYTDDRMLEMDAAICALHAQLAAERDRNAALVEALTKCTTCWFCEGVGIVDFTEIEQGIHQCAECGGDGKRNREHLPILASLSAAADDWREKVKATGELAENERWTNLLETLPSDIHGEFGEALAAQDCRAELIHAVMSKVKAAGAAEALRKLANGWHHHSGHETLPEVFPRPCQQGCTKCFILAEANKYEAEVARRTGGEDV